MALVLGFVTFRYWRRTRPGLEAAGTDDGPDEGDGDSAGGPPRKGRGRGRSRYSDLVITVPKPN